MRPSSFNEIMLNEPFNVSEILFCIIYLEEHTKYKVDNPFMHNFLCIKGYDTKHGKEKRKIMVIIAINCCNQNHR